MPVLCMINYRVNNQAYLPPYDIFLKPVPEEEKNNDLNDVSIFLI